MRPRAQRPSQHEPSLVPLADMLTNTVGIVLFILIFTVLTTGGAVLAKRLPMERPTNQDSFLVFCAEGRVYPVSDDSATVQKFLGPLGKPAGYDDMERWLKSYNARKVDTECFVLSGEGTLHRSEIGFQRSASFSLSLVFTPKPGKGETGTQINAPGSLIRRTFAAEAAKTSATSFSKDNLGKAPLLVKRLKVGNDPLARYVAEQLSESTRSNVRNYDIGDPVRDAFREALLEDLNRLIQGPCIHSPEPFARVQLSETTRALLARKPAGDELRRLNRTLLEEGFPKEIVSSQTFPYFLVRPDSVEAFLSARKLAIEQYKLSTGWRPVATNGLPRLSLTGGGYTPTTQ